MPTSVDASPGRLQEVEDRLALLERLKRKYGPTLDDVIERGDALAREQELLTGAGERAEDLQKALDTASDRYLTVARRAVAGDGVRRRGRSRARSKRCSPSWRWPVRGSRFGSTQRSLARRSGASAASIAREFFVSPNPGEELRPLARIVSGGELSRVMLALKTMAAGNEPGKTLIFDEVDAGIGGRVADVVGSGCAALGDRFQVLCITHLPQIAARRRRRTSGSRSRYAAGRTVTSVERLSDSGRGSRRSRG